MSTVTRRMRNMATMRPISALQRLQAQCSIESRTDGLSTRGDVLVGTAAHVKQQAIDGN